MDTAKEMSAAVSTQAGQRNVTNVLMLVAIALVVLFTKGTLDEVRALRVDVTQVQIQQATFISLVSELQAEIQGQRTTRRAR